MRVEIREIFVKHVTGVRLYPFAIGEVFNSAGVSLGSGMIPNGDALYQAGPIKEEIDTPVIFNPIIDPPFLGSAELATGIRQGNNW